MPQDTFFRINRQYLVHARTVRSVKEDINRKLQVNLNPEIANGHAGPHTVSRYRSSAFKNWLQVFSI
ncbi:MAG: LytTR family transcriptional regulator DNA-binding domain-containing protein [Saprospiraceae bacterium]|nr:LytTR family transcriptional regulator DNA-binding domain-containing protein [Saprospiraceae bacterium]